MNFFFRAPKSLTAINTCLDEMEKIKGRDIAFVSDWRSKSRERLDINNLKLERCRFFVQ